MGYFQLGFITSDDWGSYAMVVPREIQLTGNIFTQRIERNNLTLRTYIKRQVRKIIFFLALLNSRERHRHLYRTAPLQLIGGIP